MNNLSSFKSPRGQMRGQRGVQKYFTALIPPHHLQDHSIFSLSRCNAFSTAWVMLANSCSFILDSTHLKSSGSKVIEVLTFLRSISSLPIFPYDSILPKHINILHTMSYNVILKHINWRGKEWTGANC